jgi:hypothetical protein
MEVDDMNTAQEIFTGVVQELPSSERLRLATLILEDLTSSVATVLDYSDEWSDEDLRDLTAFSTQHALADTGELDHA